MSLKSKPIQRVKSAPKWSTQHMVGRVFHLYPPYLAAVYDQRFVSAMRRSSRLSGRLVLRWGERCARRTVGGLATLDQPEEGETSPHDRPANIDPFPLFGLRYASDRFSCNCFTQTTFYYQLKAQHLHERRCLEWGGSRIPLLNL